MSKSIDKYHANNGSIAFSFASFRILLLVGNLVFEGFFQLLQQFLQSKLFVMFCAATDKNTWKFRAADIYY